MTARDPVVEAEALLAGITPGERYVERVDAEGELGICYEVMAPGAREDAEDGMLVHFYEHDTIRAKAEAALLAAAPRLLAALVAECERVKAERFDDYLSAVFSDEFASLQDVQNRMQKLASEVEAECEKRRALTAERDALAEKQRVHPAMSYREREMLQGQVDALRRALTVGEDERRELHGDNASLRRENEELRGKLQQSRE